MNTMHKDVQVSPAYGHYEKMIHSHGVIDPTIGRQKWYAVNRGDQPIDQSVQDLAQDFIARTLASDGDPSPQELGFVILHRCGDNFYFLGLCTWRENNELWKTLFHLKTETMADFAIYPQAEPHKDTFCVWELAVVCHEMKAWTRYLNSKRSDQDATQYLTTVI